MVPVVKTETRRPELVEGLIWGGVRGGVWFVRPKCAVVLVLRLEGVEHNIDPWGDREAAGVGEVRGVVITPPDIDPLADEGELKMQVISRGKDHQSACMDYPSY